MPQPYRNLEGYLQLSRNKMLAERKKKKEKTERQVKQVLNDGSTVKTTITDYPEVDRYLRHKFPDIDLSDVPIYVTSRESMDRTAARDDPGFSIAGGVNVPWMNLIIVCSDPEIGGSGQSKFRINNLIDQIVRGKVQRQDVIIHELLHTVSSRTRSGTSFVTGEEEFVYTNCVEFYHQQGRSEEEVINHFLPFCISDVCSSLKDMRDVFACLRKTGVSVPDPASLSKSEYSQTLDEHADMLAPIIVEFGRGRAKQMIELYNRYGCQVLHSNAAPGGNVSLRMQSIDFEDDL